MLDRAVVRYVLFMSDGMLRISPGACGELFEWGLIGRIELLAYSPKWLIWSST